MSFRYYSELTFLVLQHVALLKSGSDANTYLVGDASDPLQRSLMDLELKDHLLASAHPLGMAGKTLQPQRLQSLCTLAICADLSAGAIATEKVWQRPCSCTSPYWVLVCLNERGSFTAGPSEVPPPQGGLMDSFAGSRLGAWGQLHRVTQLAVAQARDTTSSFFATAPDGPMGEKPKIASGEGSGFPFTALCLLAAPPEVRQKICLSMVGCRLFQEYYFCGL